MMDYNLSTKSATLIGNWMENRKLEEIGQPARVPTWEARKQDTFDRVMPNSRQGSAKGWNTESRAAMADVLKKPTVSDIGPRALRTQRLIVEDADRFATTVLTPTSPAPEAGTSTQSAYPKYDSSAYRPPMRRPQYAGVLEERKAAEGDVIDAPAAIAANVSMHPDRPLTFYSARLAEGVYAKGPIHSLVSPFNKSCAFSNPIGEAHRLHGETNEKPHPETLSVTGSSTAIRAKRVADINGFELGLLSVHANFARVLCECAIGPTRALSRILSELRDCSEIPAHLGSHPDVLSKTATGIRFDDTHASQDVFRHVCGELKLLISARDLECIITAADDNGSGTFSISAFLENLAAVLHPVKRSAVHKLFSGGAYSEAVESVASKFCPESSWEVTAGLLSASEALESLLRLFVAASNGADTVDVVTLEAYAAVVYAKYDREAPFLQQMAKEWQV